MREVIQGVMDVLRMSGVDRADAASAEEGEAFKLPDQTEQTREDTAYAADETDRSGRGEGRSAEEQSGRRARRSGATTDGRAGSQTAEPALAGQREALARLMRGVNRLATTVFDQAGADGEDAVAKSQEALSRAQGPESKEEAGPRLARGEMAGDSSADASADGSEERMLRQVLHRGEATRRAEGEGDQAERSVRQQMSAKMARASATPVDQRATADQAAAANVSLGQAGQGDDDLLGEAEADAFDSAQAARGGDGTTRSLDVQGPTTVVQTAAQLFSAAQPLSAPDPAALGPLGQPAAADTLMEDIIQAQRSAPGGDRVGDSDAVIRVAQSAAGALEVKVKREGNDLSLRVRAEDLAMRQVMVDALPELKHELHKANVVEGQIEVAEDGIDDQMQSDHAWDGEGSSSNNQQGDSINEANPTQQSAAKSAATSSSRHDGQLHVVA